MREDEYSPEEQRVCDYLQELMPEVGCGDDPIGFLLASHAWTLRLLNKRDDFIVEHGLWAEFVDRLP